MVGAPKSFDKLTAPRMEPVAAGVWLMRGDFPLRTMNVYFLEDEGGFTLFDAGIEAMTDWIGEAGERMGGIVRVVLGHAHPDHRGGAPGLGVPVLCHEADRADAEGDGGAHYFDYSKVRGPARYAFPKIMKQWDGGPVRIEQTLAEGDDVCGFRVVHLPGHSPGQIALWRDEDRLALTSDAFYTLNPETLRYGAPRVAHPAFTPDEATARESMRKLAAMEPAAAWPGHANPLTGDVRAQLERAAAV